MPINEMTDDVVLKLYKATLMQLEIANIHLEIIAEHGCLHDEVEPGYCKKSYTLSKKMALDTIAVFWNLRKDLLTANGYTKPENE